jgi:hypothetical protein
MSCTFGITASILRDCTKQPIAGVEEVAYAVNRKDIATTTFNGSNAVQLTDFTLLATKKAYKIEGFKKEIDAGHDLVSSTTEIDRYNQYFKFESTQIDSATLKNLDNLMDIVVFVVRKNKGSAGDGAIQVFGLETGLYKSSDTARAQGASGKRIIELTNMEEEASTVSNHVFFKTDLATSLAYLVSLL